MHHTRAKNTRAVEYPSCEYSHCMRDTQVVNNRLFPFTEVKSGCSVLYTRLLVCKLYARKSIHAPSPLPPSPPLPTTLRAPMTTTVRSYVDEYCTIRSNSLHLVVQTHIFEVFDGRYWFFWRLLEQVQGATAAPRLREWTETVVHNSINEGDDGEGDCSYEWWLW